MPRDMIRTINELSDLLGVPAGELHYLHEHAHELVTSKVERKKNGTERRLACPNNRFKRTLRKIDQRLLSGMAPNTIAMGFVKGGSIFRAAEQLSNSVVLLWFDIQNFFPSINKGMVSTALNSACSPRVSDFVAELCTRDAALPQGYPTSPRLSNLASRALDNRLGGLVEKYGLKVVRYGDDIYIGGDHWIESLVPMVDRIIEESGFSRNEEKFGEAGIQRCDQPQIVLSSLIANGGVGIAPDYHDAVEALVVYVIRFGYEAAISHELIPSRSSLYGRVGFVQKANPSKGARLLRRLKRHEASVLANSPTRTAAG